MKVLQFTNNNSKKELTVSASNKTPTMNESNFDIVKFILQLILYILKLASVVTSEIGILRIVGKEEIKLLNGDKHKIPYSSPFIFINNSRTKSLQILLDYDRT